MAAAKSLRLNARWSRRHRLLLLFQRGRLFAVWEFLCGGNRGVAARVAAGVAAAGTAGGTTTGAFTGAAPPSGGSPFQLAKARVDIQIKIFLPFGQLIVLIGQHFRSARAIWRFRH